MQRKMCVTCPFNPESRFFHLREDWGRVLDEEMKAENMPFDGTVTHGCHEIKDDGQTSNPEDQCIGHLDWIKGIKHGS